MSAKTNALFIISAFALSACFGSDSADDLADQGEDLAEKYLNEQPTPIDAMPTEGTATYNGVAGFVQGSGVSAQTIAEGAEIVSKIELQADFGASTISGTLSDFEATENDTGASDGIRVGTIDLEETTIAGNQINEGVVSGNVQGKDNQEFTVSGTWDGEFVGANADAIRGGMDAQISSEHGSENVSGAYAAEK